MLLVLAEPWCVCSDLVSQGNRTWLPAGDGLKAFFAAAAFVFQIHPSAERGAYIAERLYRLIALRALDLEQVRMLQVASDEGAEPDGIGRDLCHPAQAVGHLQIERDEVEAVDVFPLVEMGIDLAGMLVEHFGLEQLLRGRTQSVLLEEIVLFHGTILFLIEHPHHFTTVASGCSVGGPQGALLMHVQI